MADFTSLNGYNVKDKNAIHIEDVIDNLESIETQKPLSANQGKELKKIINYHINVKNYGVKGDGVTDDTQAIQDCINNNPLRTIYFPDGTYLVSSHIYTSATDTEKVFLMLSQNAIIKADVGFEDDYLIHLGETGSATSYAMSNNKSGIYGGILDTSGVCGGIYTEKTHFALIEKVKILNLGDFVGIYTSTSNNSSSDTTIRDVEIIGLNPTNLDSVGIYLHSADNYLYNCRPSGTHIGVKISSGGNSLNNVHALYNNDSTFLNYDTSIAFQINSNNNYLNDCYSDNYGVGIQITDSVYLYIKNFFQLWFSAENQNHTFMECINFYTLKAFIDGLSLNFPNNGTNTMIKSSTLNKSVGYINNVNFNDNIERLNDPSDLGLNSIYYTQVKSINNEDIVLGDNTYNITQNNSFTQNRVTSLQLAISGVNGTSGTSYTIATLPIGTRPSANVQLSCYTNISDVITPLNAWINSSGAIKLQANQTLSNRTIYISGNYSM